MPRERNRSCYRKKTTYPIDGHRLVDSRSKQLIFREVDCTLMGRSFLKEREEFDEIVARNLLEKHMKRKRGYSGMQFLVDRVKFDRNGYHGYLMYREVRHVYRFATNPAVVMFCVQQEPDDRRTYETYKFDCPSDAHTVCCLISQARQDPLYLLRTMDPMYAAALHQYCQGPPVHQTNYVTHPVETRAYPRIVATETMIDDLQPRPRDLSLPVYPYYAGTSPVLARRSRENSPAYVRRSTVMRDNHMKMMEAPPPTAREIIITPAASPKYYSRAGTPESLVFTNFEQPVRRRNVTMYREQSPPKLSRTVSSNYLVGNGFPGSRSSWQNNVTLLKNNTFDGPEITDRGPVYMYVSRTPHEPQDRYMKSSRLIY